MKRDDLAELFGQIERAPHVSALWALMLRHFRGRGFEAIAYVVLDRGHRGEAVAMFDHGFSPELIGAFAAFGYGMHDPTLRIVMATGRPGVPSELARRHPLSREEKHYRHMMQTMGVGETLCMPLYGPHGLDAYVVLGGASSVEFVKTAPRTQMHMAAQAAHLRAFALQPRHPRAGHGLSEREVEILRWVAQGKSNSVIADILSLSAATVDTYLRRVFDKLDVTDRTSAAVKGVSLGLIRA